MANLVPAFICPELYLPVSGVVQRPPHRLVRLLHPRNIHARREGIMKAHDGGFNAPRHGDFRERAPAATDRDHGARRARSEEHTSELQSQSNLVCRLLLEKKKKMHTKYAHDS